MSETDKERVSEIGTEVIADFGLPWRIEEESVELPDEACLPMLDGWAFLRDGEAPRLLPTPTPARDESSVVTAPESSV
jgi:hypothetical protein